MNWKGLLLILLLCTSIGGIIGFIIGKIGSAGMDGLIDMVDTVDKCCMDTLDYAMEQNQDCKILITGKLAECYYNSSRQQSKDAGS